MLMPFARILFDAVQLHYIFGADTLKTFSMMLCSAVCVSLGTVCGSFLFPHSQDNGERQFVNSI